MQKLIEKYKIANDGGLLRDYFLTFISYIIVGLCGMGLYYIIPLFLSQGDSEIFVVYKKTSNLLMVALIGGMGVAVPKFISENARGKSSQILTSALSFSTLLVCLTTGLFLLFPDFFGHQLFGKSLTHTDILCMALIIFSGIVNGTIYGYFRGIYNVNKANWLVIIVSVMQIGLVFFSKSINSYIFISCLSTVIVSAFFLLYFSDFLKEKIYGVNKTNEIKKIIIYGILRVPGDFALEGLTALPVILTTRSLGVAMGGQMGYSMTIFSLVLSVMSPINFVMLPKVSKILGNNEGFLPIKKLVKQTTLLIIPIILFTSGCLLLFAHFIAVNVFHSSNPDVLSFYIKFIAIAVLPFTLYTLLRSIIDAGYKYPINSLNCIISLIIFLISYYILNMMDFKYAVMVAILSGYCCLAITTLIAYKNIFKSDDIKA